MPPIAFVFPAFPVLHQTFVLWEILALREAGLPLRIYSIKRPGRGVQQPEAAALAREVTYLPSVFSAPVAAANLRALCTRPRRYLAAFARVVRAWWHDRDLAARWGLGAAPEDEELRTLGWRDRMEMHFNTHPVWYLLKSLWLVPLGVYLGAELRRLGIGRVHAQWASYPTTVALAAKWVWDIPFGFTAHAYDIYVVPHLLSAKVREADLVVTCARYNARHLRDAAADVAPARIRVNYHGVDLSRFRPPEAPRAANDPPLIVTCGRLQLYKGHHVLLRACALLSVPVHCVVIGDGPMRNHLAGLADELGIGDRVRFTGPIPQAEVAAWYARADLFVLASVVVERSGRRDVIPNVLAEAMAMRVPVVATDVAGVSELVEDGVSGRLVAPNDPTALAAALAALLGDASERSRLAEGGYRRVHAIFDRARNVRDLVSWFGGGPSCGDGAAGA